MAAAEKKTESSEIVKLLGKYIEAGKARGHITDVYNGTEPAIKKIIYSHILGKYSDETCGKLFLEFCPSGCESTVCKQQQKKYPAIDYTSGNFCNDYDDLDYGNDASDESKDKIENDKFENVIKKIKRCLSSKDNIVVHIGLFNRVDKKRGHSNLIIIRPLSKEMIRFEPNGHTTTKFDDMLGIDELHKILEKNFHGYKFVNKQPTCLNFQGKLSMKNKDMQKLSLSKIERGTCNLWSTLMTELILLSKTTKKFDEIHSEAYEYLNKNPVNFLYVIRGMYWVLIDEIKKNTGKDIGKDPYGDDDDAVPPGIPYKKLVEQFKTRNQKQSEKESPVKPPPPVWNITTRGGHKTRRRIAHMIKNKKTRRKYKKYTKNKKRKQLNN